MPETDQTHQKLNEKAGRWASKDSAPKNHLVKTLAAHSRNIKNAERSKNRQNCHRRHRRNSVFGNKKPRRSSVQGSTITTAVSFDVDRRLSQPSGSARALESRRRIISGRDGRSSSSFLRSSSAWSISRGRRRVTASVSTRGRPIFFFSISTLLFVDLITFQCHI